MTKRRYFCLRANNTISDLIDLPRHLCFLLFVSLCSFTQVPTVHAVPGLRVADDEPVPSSIRVHRGLSDSTER